MEPNPPPSTSISRDDYDAVNPARERFMHKSHFLSLPNLKRSRSTSNPASSAVRLPPSDPTVFTADIISLDPSQLDHQDEDRDKYQWAIVYENQRGMTIFSIPYYSRLSLLPSDPSPFTMPHSSPDRSTHYPVTLDNYPLPDGNWRWVSKSWMIDMRSDSGEVQHDGFEYNWVFQTHNWRAKVGPLSAGGWVRRRRWVRLMMKPAKQTRQVHNDDYGYSLTPPTIESGFNGLPVGPPIPSSVNLPDSVRSGSSLDVSAIWSSDVELNWTTCRMIMKKLGRDGRKLELWKTWLRQYHVNIGETDRKGKGRHSQWSEDDNLLPEIQSMVSSSSELLVQFRCPPREYLIPVLRRYGDSLLSSFIYPESRAELLNELGLAGLLCELNIRRKAEFWSYTSGLEQIIT